MKKILLGAVALAAFAGPAFAADMPARTYTKAPAYTAPAVIYNWTGFYIGGHVGGAFAGDNTLQSSDARFLGGVQGGFDYQFAPNWVIGVEAQYSWLTGGTNNGVLFPAGTLVTSQHRPARFGDRPARLHLGSGAALRQGWLRLARQQQYRRYRCRRAAAFTTNGNHKDGYTVGAGLEYMFAPNWSAKAEYQYYNFGKTTFTSGPGRHRRRQLPERRTHRQGRCELPVRLGWPGRRQILIPVGYRDAEKAGSRRPFLLRWCRASRRCEPALSLALPKNNFCSARNFCHDRLLWFCRLVDNEHACFCVRADLFRGGVAVPCPDRPEIRTP